MAWLCLRIVQAETHRPRHELLPLCIQQSKIQHVIVVPDVQASRSHTKAE